MLCAAPLCHFAQIWNQVLQKALCCLLASRALDYPGKLWGKELCSCLESCDLGVICLSFDLPEDPILGLSHDIAQLQDRFLAFLSSNSLLVASDPLPVLIVEAQEVIPRESSPTFVGCLCAINNNFLLFLEFLISSSSNSFTLFRSARCRSSHSFLRHIIFCPLSSSGIFIDQMWVLFGVQFLGLFGLRNLLLHWKVVLSI